MTFLIAWKFWHIYKVLLIFENCFFLSCLLGQEKHQEKEILSDCELVPFSSNNCRFQSINFWCSKACPPFCFYKLIKLFIWYQEPPEGSNLYFNLWRNSYPRYCCRTIFKVINIMLRNFQLKVNLIRALFYVSPHGMIQKVFCLSSVWGSRLLLYLLCTFKCRQSRGFGDKAW